MMFKMMLYYEKILQNEAFYACGCVTFYYVTGKICLGVHIGSQSEKCSMGFESQSILLLDIVKELQEGIVLAQVYSFWCPEPVKYLLWDLH